MSFDASAICHRIYQIRADALDNLEDSYPDSMAFFFAKF
jgi:hypothetical protein